MSSDFQSFFPIVKQGVHGKIYGKNEKQFFFILKQLWTKKMSSDRVILKYRGKTQETKCEM